MPYLIVLALIVWMVVAAVEAVGAFFDQHGVTLLALGVAGFTLYVLNYAIREFRRARYFSGDEFLELKDRIASVVADHNELTDYVSEMRDGRLFSLGASLTGSQAHLASFENTSEHKYNRDRNTPEYSAINVHNCSLQIVRNASANPIKYLMKYFGIKANEKTLADVEEVGESISRLEEALENLAAREREITNAIHPPAFILKYYADEFMSQVGVELSPVVVPYAEYSFEYVSAGGNSSQRTAIKLDSDTVDELVEALAQKIKFKKSAAGQRALMTAKFRKFIKDRDGHSCKQCFASVADEPNLLLEVDHIVPVSKGGLSTEENLQTLCWKCNRTKSNKLPVGMLEDHARHEPEKLSSLRGSLPDSSRDDRNSSQCPGCGERVLPEWRFCSRCRWELADSQSD